jgi:hypothetical protein
MALTKITKHIVHGATIVQVRYKDISDIDTSADGETDWGSITITPQYADSTTDILFSGTISTEHHESSSPTGILYLDVDGTNEYFINHVTRQGSMSFSYEQYGNRNGSSVVLAHRLRFGDTNLHTIKVQTGKDGNSGNIRGYDGFFLVKEIAGGILSANSTNTFVDNR